MSVARLSSRWKTRANATAAISAPETILTASACRRRRPAASCPPRAIRSIGNAAPAAYASVSKIARSPTESLAATTVTVASTGPAQGTNTSPSVAPRKNPPPTPPGRKREKNASGRSISCPTRGMRSVAAITKRRTIAALRRKSSREPELVEEPRGEQGEHGEAGDEPGDDAQRLASRRARGEQDRQHRQHARRHRGHDPREKADGEQNQHPFVDPVCR